MFEVQQTKWAHVHAPDSAYETVSKHRKLKCAYAALRKLEIAQDKRCQPGSWDCNMRILECDKPLNSTTLDLLRYAES
jgi:hypothetical protein